MPDFDNLKIALLNKGEPKRVPLFEGSVHEELKSKFLGKPMTGLETEVEFWIKAGYDYVPLTIGLRQIIRGEISGVMGAKNVQTTILKPAEARYNPFSDETSVRMCSLRSASNCASQPRTGTFVGSRRASLVFGG